MLVYQRVIVERWTLESFHSNPMFKGTKSRYALENDLESALRHLPLQTTIARDTVHEGLCLMFRIEFQGYLYFGS